MAAPVAGALGAPLDVVLVRKLGVPGQPELAMGAVAAVGERIETVRNETILQRLEVTPSAFDDVRRREIEQLHRRQRLYRGDRPPVAMTGLTIILIDDGLATGATMRAAVTAVRSTGPARIVVAAPIGSSSACRELGADADRVVCPWVPANFYAVGQGYRDFSPTTDEEVCALLDRSPG